MDGNLWHCAGGSNQNHPKEKEKKESKVVEEALQIAEERREVKARKKGKDIPKKVYFWMQSSREYQGEIRSPS